MITIAKNGKAIVNGLVIPRAEMLVLTTLMQSSVPLAALEIVNQLDELMSIAAVYTLLKRLDTRGGLVTRKNVTILVHGTKVERVLWTSTLYLNGEPREQ